MYTEFFNFSEKPFNLTPDPKYFFSSDKHRTAFDSLCYAIAERKGFAVITGDIGSGKTTVCRRLIEQLGSNTTLGVITNTFVTPRQLIEMIMEEFELEVNTEPKHKLIGRLNQFLIAQLAEDRNVVLVIDEAQNLSPNCLEEVRMLSNLETEKDKLIQIVLMGQPELRDKLRLSSLIQLKQRIALHYHLGPLDFQEAKDYIEHRLKIASQSGTLDHKIFTDHAIQLIYEFSHGTPRIINNLCDNALLSAYAEGSKVVTSSIVEEASKDIFDRVTLPDTTRKIVTL